MAEPPATMIPFVERMPRAPTVEKHRSMSWITDRLAGIPQRRTPLWWWCAVAVAGSLASVFFWYLGLVPDLATVRDRALTRVAKFAYGLLALGWRGGHRQWRDYEMAYLVLAGISTPLVLSVHSTVSFDFATSLIPGWHTTIFPPYFVAGAIFGGFAMVLTLIQETTSQKATSLSLAILL